MGSISSRLESVTLSFLPRTLFGAAFGPRNDSQFGAIEALIQRAVQRRHLGELDDRLLKDIGLSKAEAYRETLKPFWLK